jgi:hypothetical protein
MQRTLLAALLLLGALSPATAVLIDTSGTITFQTIEPTNSNISGWTSGWGSSGITGWDYVGVVNGGSGVYLGNDWVITAGHVGPGNFTLNGVTYNLVAGSATSITDSNGQADLSLFEISTAPSLPSLSITGTSTATGNPSVGDPLAMIGFGGGHGETWGYNTIGTTGLLVSVDGYPYVSTDLSTTYGSSNLAQLTGGDSGGGDFTFNTTSSQWQLAGINEAIDGSGNSYFVQLSAYSSQINAIVAVPEPYAWTLLVLGILVLGIGRKIIRTKRF